MAPAPDTILLDVDGTLFDSTYLHALAWTRAFRSVSEQPPWARVHRAIGLGGDKLVTHVLGASSSGAERFTTGALELLELSADDVDAVTSADDVEETKPAPDLLEVALDRAGGSSGLSVGDTTWDVEAATRSGIPCVGVLTGGFSAQELTAAGAIDVVASVADLLGRNWV